MAILQRGTPAPAGRPSSAPRRPKAVTRARTPPLQTRERNRQKVETASQEARAAEAAGENRYEKFLQPEGFSVPSKSFTWVSPTSLAAQRPTRQQQVLVQVQQSQPPSSLTEASSRSVSSDSAMPISPALTHRPSQTLSVIDSRGGSPSTVPQVSSETSGSPDKENNPPLSVAAEQGGRGAVAWEDPAGVRRPLEASPASRSGCSPAGVRSLSPFRQVLQPAVSSRDNLTPQAEEELKPPCPEAPAQSQRRRAGSLRDLREEERPRRRSAQPTERPLQEAAPRRKSVQMGDRSEALGSREGAASIVQEKISLWETMSAGSGRNPKMSTSTSGSRGRATGVSGSAWYRCFSDMTRNLRQETSQMARLMERLREVPGCDEAGSPFSTRSNEMSSPGEDVSDSPETQKIKAQLVDMNRHLKLTKKLYRAMDGLLRHSLDPVFAQESREGRCASTSSTSSPASPRQSLTASIAGPRRPSDKVFEEDTTACHSEVDSSRNSHSTGDSEGRRSQVQDSPRFAVPNWMRPELRCSDERKKDEEALVSTDLGGTEQANNGDIDEETATNTSSSNDISESFDNVAPLPGQEGMPRHETILYHLEQQELHRQVTLIVPEGMDATRRVNFIYEDQEMTVAIPEGYDIGQQVTVQVPTRKRPPLERNSTQAFHRGHQHLPDRQLVMENLRHCCRVTTSISLDHPEYKTRYQLYGMLQGKSMTPMLPEMPEGEEPQDGAL